jgi:uracil-DNA glycosylase family 4
VREEVRMVEGPLETMSEFIGELKEYLLQRREEGAGSVHLSPEGKKALEMFLRGARGVKSLAELKEMMRKCHKCAIGEDRLNLVFGEGSENAEIVFVGEAPGADEDEQGRPFVGRAGKLLRNIIRAMGYEPEEVYIANILKCRPPANRDPLPEEMERCFPYLVMQLELIKPKVIVAVGKHAAHALLGVKTPITKLRGNMGRFRGIPVMPTFHTSYLLRNQNAKIDVFNDMNRVLEFLGREPMKRGR